MFYLTCHVVVVEITKFECKEKRGFKKLILPLRNINEHVRCSKHLIHKLNNYLCRYISFKQKWQKMCSWCLRTIFSKQYKQHPPTLAAMYNNIVRNFAYRNKLEQKRNFSLYTTSNILPLTLAAMYCNIVRILLTDIILKQKKFLSLLLVCISQYLKLWLPFCQVTYIKISQTQGWPEHD